MGNKKDLENKYSLFNLKYQELNSRLVSYEEGEKFAQENGLHFIEASAKCHENVEKV